MKYLPYRRRDIEEGGIGPIEKKRQRKPWVYKDKYDRVVRWNRKLGTGMAFAFFYIFLDLLGHLIGPWFIDHFILFKW